MFEELVGLIDKIKDDSIGEWIVDKENDGTFEHPIQMPFVVYSRVVRQFERVVYNFEEEHPEFELNQYGSILERYDIKWETQSMSTVDVSKMDGQGVMALIMAAVRAERFCDGALKEFFENGSIEKWLCRLKEIDESGEYFVSKPMSNIELIKGSCADQNVDVVVNAANNGLWAGGGICGVIFKKAGMAELTDACQKHKTPLKDGDAVKCGYACNHVLYHRQPADKAYIECNKRKTKECDLLPIREVELKTIMEQVAGRRENVERITVFDGHIDFLMKDGTVKSHIRKYSGDGFNKTPFSRKIFCGYCGSSIVRMGGNKRRTCWMCSVKKTDKAGCEHELMSDGELYGAAKSILGTEENLDMEICLHIEKTISYNDRIEFYMKEGGKRAWQRR